MSVIEIQNLKKYFKDTKAIDDISFNIERGEIFGFLGPNGAGKTTTIRCMMDFIRPTSGRIIIMGKDAHKDSVELKNKIGYLSGNVRLYDKWTGKNHIDFIRKNGDKDNIKSLSDFLGLDINKKAGKLSSGNRQKLGLILSLVNHPDILIFDEPTNSLDPLLQNHIYELLNALSENGTTIFMSSHNLSEVERICTRVGVIRQGKIVATDSIAGLKKKRVYNIKVYFNQKVDSKIFSRDGIEVMEDLPDGVSLTIRGDVKEFLAQIASLPVEDIEIRHASLEDIFMEFYK